MSTLAESALELIVQSANSNGRPINAIHTPELETELNRRANLRFINEHEAHFGYRHGESSRIVWRVRLWK